MRGLYAITDQSSGDLLISKAKLALIGGISTLQYRDKSSDTDQKIKDALALQALCKEYKTPFIINDDIELALAIGADGVHLGKDDQSIHYARSRLGNTAIIGISCYNNLDLAKSAEQQGASYIAFGSFFSSPTKPNAPQATAQLLAKAKSCLTTPICCIGGITLDNAPLLIDNGADMIAVITSLFDADDIKQTARYFSAMFPII
jgi:thiamine-phosphate pyrophosphorylase